jgi:hypothetical protein
MDVTSDHMKTYRRRCMTGWHSNQKTTSPEEFMLKYDIGGGA